MESPQTSPKDLHPSPDTVGNCDFQWGEYEPELQGYIAYKMQGVDPSIVEDIVQEVAIAVSIRDEKGSLPNPPEKWLQGVARNKINDYWRKHSKLHAHGELPEDLESGEPSPYEWVLKVEQSAQVTDALKQLPHEDRLLLEQKYIGGESCKSLSHTLGKSLKSTEYRLAKARQALRNLLKPLIERPK